MTPAVEKEMIEAMQRADEEIGHLVTRVTELVDRANLTNQAFQILTQEMERKEARIAALEGQMERLLASTTFANKWAEAMEGILVAHETAIKLLVGGLAMELGHETIRRVIAALAPTAANDHGK